MNFILFLITTVNTFVLTCDSQYDDKIKSITIENINKESLQLFLNQSYANLEEGDFLKFEFSSDDLVYNNNFDLLCKEAGFETYYCHRKGKLLPNHAVVRIFTIILKKME